ncbi:MAG TPA: DUF58 domain-containing protein [Sporichthyaceae bacterium]|nr:DUF58 domain-containing protein [Sporichthyaceae bacterium]
MTAVRARLVRLTRELTWRGRFSVAAGLVAMVVGLPLHQMILVRVAVLLLFLPPVCLLLVHRTRHQVRASRRIEPGRVSAGEQATVTVAVANNGLTGCGLLLAADTLPVGLAGRTRFAVRGLAAAATAEARYQVDCLVRGRHPVGPLTLRLTDPFGMSGVDRSISGTDDLVVIPKVHPLPHLRFGAEVAGTSDTRKTHPPTAGDDDLAVREYRRGDSMRRINWRVTARRGELMVRQEEHPPQTRATLLLDSRAEAHRGEGLDSSLEWAVSAAASIGVQLLARRFALRAICESGIGLGALVPEVLPPGPGVEHTYLDGLAVLEASKTRRLLEPGRFSGLGGDGVLVAIVGDLSTADAEELAARRRAGTVAIALVLDVDTWGRGGRRRSRGGGSADHEAVFRNRGWGVATVRAGDDVAEVWQRVGVRSEPRPGAA